MRIVVAVLAVVGLLGCSAVPTAPDGGRPDGPGFVRARVDGVEFRADSIAANVFRFPGANLLLQAVMRSPTGLEASGIFLPFDSLAVGAELPLRPTGPFVPAYVTTREPGVLFRLDSVQPGTLTVTGADPFNRRVSGRFQFRARLYEFRDSLRSVATATDRVVVVTDGVFDVTLVTAGLP